MSVLLIKVAFFRRNIKIMTFLGGVVCMNTCARLMWVHFPSGTTDKFRARKYARAFPLKGRNAPDAAVSQEERKPGRKEGRKKEGQGERRAGRKEGTEKGGQGVETFFEVRPV